MLLIFLLPLAINSLHDLMNHEHAVCNSKTVKHIHEKDVDCELHLLKQSTSFLAENNFEILINTIITKNNSIAYADDLFGPVSYGYCYAWRYAYESTIYYEYFY